ncbi:MAG TPA: sarcosine oxidase subunit delta [Polyangiales bacterium]|nr:sarcosine oxidase subunit delta [Polyangiales bacterium]
MKLLDCPNIGARPTAEFTYGGELRHMPDPDQATDAEWADYVWNRTGAGGVKKEWWFHVPSATWFIAERDTRTDRVLRTFLIDEGAS